MSGIDDQHWYPLQLGESATLAVDPTDPEVTYGSTEGFGAILRYDGTSWQAGESPTTSDLWSVYGSGPLDVWAVGAAGTGLRYSP